MTKITEQIVRIWPRREIRDVDHIHVSILVASWMMMVILT